VHRVWVEGYAVGCMEECSMTVIIYPALHWPLSTASITRITSVISILLVNFASNLVFIFSLHCNKQHYIKFFPCVTTLFSVWSFQMVSTTPVHVLTNCYVSQINHWSQEKVDLMQHCTRLAIPREMSTKIAIWVSISPAMHDQSVLLCPNLMAIW